MVAETAVQSAFLKTNTLQALLQIGVKGMLNSGVQLLINRMEKIDLQGAARQDVAHFLKDTTQLDLWSNDFFRHWIDRLKFE